MDEACKLLLADQFSDFPHRALVTESLSSRGRTSEINFGTLDLRMLKMEEIFSMVTTTSPCKNLIVNEFAVEAQIDSYRPGEMKHKCCHSKSKYYSNQWLIG